MELEVKKPNRLEDGQHSGTIIALEERSKPYEYLDIVIEEEILKTKIKVGYPKILMKESKLGLLFKRLRIELKEGEKIDPEKLLVGRNCSFIIMNEQTSRGTFPKIIGDSLKAK